MRNKLVNWQKSTLMIFNLVFPVNFNVVLSSFSLFTLIEIKVTEKTLGECECTTFFVSIINTVIKMAYMDCRKYNCCCLFFNNIKANSIGH